MSIENDTNEPLPLPLPLPLPTSDPISLPSNEVDDLLLLQSSLGQPIALAYGRHIVRGNIILQHEVGNRTVIFIALGDGEWDSVEVLFVNGKVVPLSSVVHFHPGIDGETGTETTANDGNQKVCTLWPNFADKFTFSNTAYVALNLAKDVEAARPGFDIVGIYKTRKVRIFDNTGAITFFQYSTNPAWIALDLLIEHEIRKRALVGSALTAAQIARIDFQSFVDWAADCDVDIGGGKKRFEANIALTRQSDLKRAIELMLVVGRAYLTTVNGKITAAMDKSRTAVATITRDEILKGQMAFGRKSSRSLANIVKIQYRNLNSGDGVGTISTVGTTLTGVGTKFTEMYKVGEPIQVRSGTEDREVAVVATITSDTAGTLEAAYSVDQTTESHGNPALDFQVSVRESLDETVITETDKEIKVDLDVGNMDAGQAERSADYIRKRTQLLRRAAFVLPPGVVSAGDGAKEWTPGEVITGPNDIEADPAETESWEILEAEDLEDGSRRVGVQIFDTTIFSDTEGDQQPQTQTVENDGARAITDAAAGLTKTPAIPGETIFHDSFDLGSIARWTVVQNDGTLTFPAGFLTGLSMKEVDAGAGTGLEIYQPMEVNAKWVGSRFLFRMAETATGEQMDDSGFRNAGTSGAAFAIDADGGTNGQGRFKSQSGPTVTVVDDFERGVWHEIIQIVDAANELVFYIIDGVTYTNAGAGYAYSVTQASLNRFYLKDNIASVGVNYEIDDGYLFILAEDKTAAFVPESTERKWNTAAHLTYRPLTNMLTATDAGSDVTVSIAAFTLRIPGIGDKTVSLGSLTGEAYDSLLYIYFDQDNIDEATPWSPTFVATTTKETALNAAGRVYVGSIRTPVATGSDTVGNNDGGSGAQYGNILRPLPSVNTIISVGYGNPQNAYDGDGATVSRSGAVAEHEWGGFPAVGLPGRKALTLKIESEWIDGDSSSNARLRYSTNNGVSFTNIYNIVATGNRARQIDSITLPIKQNVSQVLVRADTTGVGVDTHDIYQIWIEEEF